MQEGLSFPTDSAAKRGLSMRMLIALVLGAVALGAAAMWWFSRSDTPAIGDSSPIFSIRSEDEPAPVAAPAPGELAPALPNGQAAPEGTVEEARQAVERVEQVVVQQGGLDSRIAAMEQRLTRLDLQSQSAAGDAARAEALLIAFAARRAIERGQPLTYLTDPLRLRFGDARPNAVQTIIDAAQDPVTLDQLLARFEGLADTLSEPPADEGLLSWFGREISQLFVVRREDTPSPVAEQRIDRARRFLESGRIEPAVAEIRELPNAVQAGDWIADAERYAAAQRALEVLESAAIADPRELRDSAGDQVNQRSPATGDRAATRPNP